MLTFFPRKILFPSKNLLSLPGVNLETCWFDGLSRFNVYRTQTNRHSSKIHISTRRLVSLACNISLALFLIGLITIHLQVQSSIIFLIDIFAIIFNSLSQGSLVGLLLSIIQLTPPPPFPSHSSHQLYKVFQDLLNIYQTTSLEDSAFIFLFLWIVWQKKVQRKDHYLVAQTYMAPEVVNCKS